MSLELSANAYESELKKARREFKNRVESLEASHIPIFIWQRCTKCGKHRSKPACICDNVFTFFSMLELAKSLTPKKLWNAHARNRFALKCL